MTTIKYNEYKRIVAEFHKSVGNKYDDGLFGKVFIEEISKSNNEFFPEHPYFAVHWKGGAEINGDNPIEFAHMLSGATALCNVMNSYFEDITVEL